MGGWATVNGTDWASVNGSGTILPVVAYTLNTWASGNNTTATLVTHTSDAFTTNSLRFIANNGATGYTVALSSTSSTSPNVITSGGILVTPGAGPYTSMISGGYLTAADLIIDQFDYQADGSGALIISSAIVDNGVSGMGNVTSVIKAGPGILKLAGPNTYTAGTEIFGGILSISSDTAGDNAAAPLGSTLAASTPNDITIYGGTLQAAGKFSLNANRGIVLGVAIQGTGGTIDVTGNNTFTIPGLVSGFAGLVSGYERTPATAYGSLTLVDTGKLVLTGSNTYSGGTIINSGILSISSDASGNYEAAPLGYTWGGPTPDNIMINGGTLQATGGTMFSLNANRGIALGAYTGSGNGTFDVVSGTALTIPGAITNNGYGTGSLTLVDSGTMNTGNLILSGANTYSGGTIINSGVLSFSSEGTYVAAPLGAIPALPVPSDVVIDGAGSSPAATLDDTATVNVTLSSNRGITIGATTGGGIGAIEVYTSTATLYIPGIVVVSAAATLQKTGAGTLEIDGAPILENSSVLNPQAGNLRLNYATPATIGSGVTAFVSGGATLELAGAVSQLNQSVNVINNSTATAGLLVSSSVNQNVGTITGTGNIVVNDGASLTAYQIRQSSLTIGSGATVTLLPSGSGSTTITMTTGPALPNNVNFSSAVSSLLIASTGGVYTGTLDIGNNGLVIAYGTAPDPYTTINSMVEAGYNGGFWTSHAGSTGITSTLAGAAVAMHISTPLNIGLEDFTPGVGNFSHTTFIVFEGQTVATNAILVRLTYMDDIVLAGDMAQNNATSDALIFAANYGTGTTWALGDLVHDGGPVGSSDALLFAANYAVNLPSLDGSTGNEAAFSGTAAVPEPAGLALAAIGALALVLLARRRHRARPLAPSSQSGRKLCATVTSRTCLELGS